MRKSLRREKGSSLFLVALFAFLLVILIWLGFEYTMMLRGSRHARNTVDAAVLNIAKRAPENRIIADNLYRDVADSEGKVGLSNINRVWGKAYLINANVQDMREEEVITDDAIAHGDTAYRLAEWLNQKLERQLTDPKILNMHFQEMSALRHNDAVLEEMRRADEDGYKTAMVGRGGPSNLNFKQEQLPGKTKADSAMHLDGSTALKGYTPMKINGRNFCFVSFPKGELPSLISDSQFAQDRTDSKPIKDCGSPVSNAFSATGIIKGPNSSYKASACGLANPQRNFTMALPRSYITVQFRNRAKWYFENKWVNETSYGFTPETQNGIPLYENKVFVGKPFLRGGGYLDGYASLGNEYKDANLSKSLEFSSDGKKLAMEKMLQRIREIKADFTMADLVKLFADEVVVPHAARYYIYPVYHTPDLTDPEIVMTADLDDLPKWMDAESKPEGEGKIVCDGSVLVDEPNYCWGERVMGGMGDPPDKWTEVSGKIWWKPGTGYGQCLGEMRYEHLTEVFFKSPGTEDKRNAADPGGAEWLQTGRSRLNPFNPPVMPTQTDFLRGPVNAGPKHLTTVHELNRRK